MATQDKIRGFLISNLANCSYLLMGALAGAFAGAVTALSEGYHRTGMIGLEWALSGAVLGALFGCPGGSIGATKGRGLFGAAVGGLLAGFLLMALFFTTVNFAE
jgi:hypothetical protein